MNWSSNAVAWGGNEYYFGHSFMGSNGSIEFMNCMFHSLLPDVALYSIMTIF